jgi:hypothetical protein
VAASCGGVALKLADTGEDLDAGRGTGRGAGAEIELDDEAGATVVGMEVEPVVEAAEAYFFRSSSHLASLSCKS